MNKFTTLILLGSILSVFLVSWQPNGTNERNNPSEPTQTQPTTWRVVEIQTLPSDISEFKIRDALPAHDGHSLAYDKFDFSGDEPQGFVCRYDFLTVNEACVLKPNFLWRTVDNISSYRPSRWSDDSTRLAFVGDSLRSNRDYDFNIIDFTDSTWTVLLEDTYTSDEPISVEFTEPFTLEITPVWSPDSTQIAMEQITFDNSQDTSNKADIIIFNIEAQSIETIVALNDLFPDMDNLSGLTKDMSWSPDGQQLAAIFWHSDTAFETQNGIWVIDIATGDTQYIAKLDDIAASLSKLTGYQIQPKAITPTQISWSPDGQHILVVASIFGEAIAGSEWVYLIDVATGELYPLPLSVDLTQGPVSHLSATWSPHGDYVLWVGYMPLFNEEIDGLIEDEPASGRISIVNLANNTTQTLGGLPYVNRSPLAWGSDNTILINTYFLRLEAE